MTNQSLYSELVGPPGHCIHGCCTQGVAQKSAIVV